MWSLPIGRMTSDGDILTLSSEKGLEVRLLDLASSFSHQKRKCFSSYNEKKRWFCLSGHDTSYCAIGVA